MFDPRHTVSQPRLRMNSATLAHRASRREIRPVSTYKLLISALVAAVALTQWMRPATLFAAPRITHIQSNYAEPQWPQTSVSVSFNSAQNAGDLNVIVVGWADTTATVTALWDSVGNKYTRAVGPTQLSGELSQSIYYAKNIAGAAAGANVVTVTFSTAAIYPDIRIFEYSGADPSHPVDVTAAGRSRGSSTSATPNVATTTASDLIFGANRVGTGMSTGPGSGFVQRQLTPVDGDLTEDEMVTTTRKYRATARLDSISDWIMQMVAFRTPSNSDPTATLAANPASVSFGSVAVGAKSSQSVTLSNSGTASLTVSQATATGSGFSISGLSLPLTLAARQSATFSVSFSPTVGGSASGRVSILSSASNPTLTIPLSGTGATQTLSASPSSLSFGNVTVNSDSILPVVVTNTGNSNVTVSNASVGGAAFSVSAPSLPLTLAAGQNTSFSVTFAPTTTGSFTGSLFVASNASNSPTVTSLSGAGVDQHTVSLTWAASSSPNVTGYNVYRGAVSGGPYTKLDSSLVTRTAYTDSSIQAGQTYYYVVTAVNSQGLESSYSNQASIVVPSP